jgi:hypothetical protein
MSSHISLCISIKKEYTARELCTNDIAITYAGTINGQSFGLYGILFKLAAFTFKPKANAEEELKTFR